MNLRSFLEKMEKFTPKNMQNLGTECTKSYYIRKSHPWHIAQPIRYGYTVIISICLLISLSTLVLHILHPDFFVHVNPRLTQNFFLHFGVQLAHKITNWSFMLIFITSIAFWLQDIRLDSLDRRILTKSEEKNYKLGIILFIMSEIMLFFAFFWAFFHSSCNSSIWVGAVWPPVGIETLDPYKLPLLNTVLLVVSGITINAFYYEFINFKYVHDYRAVSRNTFFLSNEKIMITNFMNKLFIRFNLLTQNLFVTLLLGVAFLYIQLYEYKHATFNISDGIYGSVFYCLTGLHGFHVFLGLIMIFSCYIRVKYTKDFTKYISPYIGLTSAVWYWHFVDVVWLLLYIVIYLG